MIPVKDSNCCCAKTLFGIICLIGLLVLIPAVTWYNIHQHCENTSVWKDICGYGTVNINSTLFTCTCEPCYALMNGKCEYARKYYALAAVLQTIPVPGLFGAGYAYLELWTHFAFQCIVACLSLLTWIGLMNNGNVNPDALAVEGLFAVSLISSVSVFWWLISWCMMWANYYSDANGVELYK
jgi:hypothetical protein